MDVLVNNAGVQVAGAVLREDLGEFNSEVVDWTLQTVNLQKGRTSTAL